MISLLRRVIKVSISLIFYLGIWLHRRLGKMIGRELPGTCVVLYYHSVPRKYQKRFAEQMDILLRHAKPVSSDIKGPLGIGVHHAAVVFHDSFVSVCDNALPEIARRRIPTTLFVPTGYLGKRPGWAMEYGHADQDEVVADVDRLRSLDSKLVAIGSHSVTHSDLRVLSERQAFEEFRGSKLALEAILNRPVDLFAFPYGGWTDKLVPLAKQAGYSRIFTIEPTLAFSEPGEYITGSCAVAPTDWRLEFTLKMLGAYSWAPYFGIFRQQTKLLWRKWIFHTS
jgi:peptidoglycan/xylan/chitin deacetylase (PgdA/CDA1 family)